MKDKQYYNIVGQRQEAARIQCEQTGCVEFAADGVSRLDVDVAQNMRITRSRAAKLIECGRVTVSGILRKASHISKAGETVAVQPLPAKPQYATPQDIPLNIVYEDECLLVVDKPCGMVVHPAAGNRDGTLVNALLGRCTALSNAGDAVRPGIVHRIDKETSGLLIVAKDDASHHFLSAQLSAHSFTRKYAAIVHGVFREDSGVVDAPIGRHPVHRKRMAVTPGGKRAVTRYSVVQRYAKHTLLECRLETGRTHQIRVHMSHINHPIVGDAIYGVKKENVKTQHQLLHAMTIGFMHPRTREYMEFESEIPERFYVIR